MQFHEKVRRQVQALDLNRSKAAREVGLPVSTINNYVSTTASLPRVDIAIKIARALKVPLEWLADDEQDWPPPSQPSVASPMPPLEKFGDVQIIEELAKRRRRAQIDFLDELKKVISIDWDGVASALESVPPGDAAPDSVKRAAQAYLSLLLKGERLQSDWSVGSYSLVHHNELPGSDRPLNDFYTIEGPDWRIQLMNLKGLDRFIKAQTPHDDLVPLDTIRDLESKRRENRELIAKSFISAQRRDDQKKS